MKGVRVGELPLARKFLSIGVEEAFLVSFLFWFGMKFKTDRYSHPY